MKHLNIKISGRVQGIFFRATAKEEAEKLGIKGFARNEPDGTVYMEVEGEKDNLDKFISWCHQGPTLARVDKIDVIEDSIKKFTGFSVH